MNMPEPNYEIHSSRPVVTALVVLALCGITAAVTWYVKPDPLPTQPNQIILASTREASLDQQIEAMQEAYGMLREENKYIHEEREALTQQLVQLEQASQIDKQAIVDVRNNMVELQDQIFDLRRELEFYRGIMDTTQTATGLQVQGWYTRPTGTKNQYRYKIVLTNLTNKNKDATGSLKGTIKGSDNGKEKELTLKTVLLSETKFAFKFRNFKVFEGHVQLPESFEPQRVHIVLTDKNGKKTLTENEFDWVTNNR